MKQVALLLLGAYMGRVKTDPTSKPHFDPHDPHYRHFRNNPYSKNGRWEMYYHLESVTNDPKPCEMAPADKEDEQYLMRRTIQKKCTVPDKWTLHNLFGTCTLVFTDFLLSPVNGTICAYDLVTDYKYNATDCPSDHQDLILKGYKQARNPDDDTHEGDSDKVEFGEDEDDIRTTKKPSDRDLIDLLLDGLPQARFVSWRLHTIVFKNRKNTNDCKTIRFTNKITQAAKGNKENCVNTQKIPKFWDRTAEMDIGIFKQDGDDVVAYFDQTEDWRAPGPVIISPRGADESKPCQFDFNGELELHFKLHRRTVSLWKTTKPPVAEETSTTEQPPTTSPHVNFIKREGKGKEKVRKSRRDYY